MSDGNKIPSAQPCSSGRDEFTATHWTEVAQAANPNNAIAARQALEKLCARYWPAIYAYLRRNNHGPDDAADLTQGFFEQLIEENTFARADRSKGRFRSFLLGALKRFLADDQRRKSAQKRSGSRIAIPFDCQAMEDDYLEDTNADPSLTPDQLYDRRWAAAVLEAAFEDLQNEFKEADQSSRFERLKRYLSEDAQDGDYAAEAAQLGISPKAMSSAVSRLRDRYRDLVRRAVLATVACREEVDPEFCELFR